MILLPIGHEESGVRRLPWVTFGVMALCVLAFFASGRAMLFAEDDIAVAEEAERVLDYYFEHPYLELDPEFSRRLLPGAESANGQALAEAMASTVAPPGSESARADEQRALDGLVRRALGALDSHPLLRWGLIPASPSATALLSHMFLHAGWLHLIGNLLILYLAGPFIEDVWGRPLYAGFYLASGIAAALAHVAFNPASTVPMIGASGAIAGVMGAFLVRYRQTRIRFFYMVGILWRGTFSAPAWAMLPLWFGQQIFFGLLTRDLSEEAGGGVAYWAHIGGFAFGFGVAAALTAARIEQRLIAPRLAGKLETAVVHNPAIDRALDARGRGRADEAFATLLDEARRDPGNVDVASALWSVALDLDRTAEAAPAVARAVARGLQGGDAATAVGLWDELQSSVPAAAIDPATLTRLARGLARLGREDEARMALRRALLAAGGGREAVVGLQIARAARALDPRLARGAARWSLGRSDLGPAERAEAQQILVELAAPADCTPASNP